MKYKSEIYEVVHQDAVANFEVGAISETEMREFDEMCLVQEPEAERPTPDTVNGSKSPKFSLFCRYTDRIIDTITRNML